MGTKAWFTFILWNRSGQIKPGQRCAALTLLAWLSLASVGLALRHSASSNEARCDKRHCCNREVTWWREYTKSTFLYRLCSNFLLFRRLICQLKRLPLLVKCLVGEKLVNWRGRRVLSGFWPAPASLHSILPSYRDGVTACHCGCSTIQLRPPDYCGAQKKHQGLPLSSVHSFLSLFKAENQSAVHTHTYTRLTSFSLPSVYSAASDHLDLTCIVKNWAALPLSSSLSFAPFLFQLSVINVQVLQYTNRAEEESEEWGMNWWMGG